MYTMTNRLLSKEQGQSRPDTAQTFMITRAPAVPTNGFDHPPLGPSTCVVNGTTVVEEVWEGDCYLMGREFLENHSRVMAGTTLTVAVTMVLGGLLAVLLFRRVR